MYDLSCLLESFRISLILGWIFFRLHPSGQKGDMMVVLLDSYFYQISFKTHHTAFVVSVPCGAWAAGNCVAIFPEALG